MKEFTITPNDDGKRIDAFLKKLMPSASTSLIYKYIRTNKVKINRKKPKENTRLCTGDEVRIFGDDSLFETKFFTPCKYSLDIVYEDDNLIIINKPAGIACQPDNIRKNGTLADFVKSYLYEKKEYVPEAENTFSPALCNRIDFNTSGLVIAAKNMPTLRLVNEKLRNHEIRKFYVCKTKNAPPDKCGIIKGQMQKDADNISRVVDEGGKYAETHYRVLSADKDGCIIEVEIITGRSHQIRVHLSSIGCPIIGDSKYGDSGSGQLLCSYKTTFDFKGDAGHLDYLKGKSFEIKNPFI